MGCDETLLPCKYFNNNRCRREDLANMDHDRCRTVCLLNSEETCYRYCLCDKKHHSPSRSLVGSEKLPNGRRYKFSIELSPPIDPKSVPAYCQQLDRLLDLSVNVSITSHNVGNISGFDRAYNLAAHLFKLNPQLNILFHVTCNDINRVNIFARLTLLRELGVRKLLVITGENYTKPNDRQNDFFYENSSQLIKHIQRDFSCWFDSIAAAGFPSGADSPETDVEKLREKVACGADTIYTQCLFDANSFVKYRKMVKDKIETKLHLVPSIAMFHDSNSLHKVAKLARGQLDDEMLAFTCHVISRCGGDSVGESRAYALHYLRLLCKKLNNYRPGKLINICTFGLPELAAELIEELYAEV